MSLKGTEIDVSLKDGAKVQKAVADRNVEALAEYVKSGVISTEVYNQLIEDFRAFPNGENPYRDILVPASEKPKKASAGKDTLKLIRNALSIFVGLITYVITETLLTYAFLFLLKIPILSFLMTGYIPVDIFLNASVASGATFATFYVIKRISDYKNVNYSVIAVFGTLLIIYIVALIYKVYTMGFDFSKLTSTLIFIGTFIFSCCMAGEDKR